MRGLTSRLGWGLLLLTLCILFSGAVAQAAVYRVLSTGTVGVDCEFKTLVEAINAAQLSLDDDIIQILDNAVYRENLPAIGIADSGSLTIEAASGCTPTITRATLDDGAVLYFQGTNMEPAPTITIKGASPTQRIKVRNESGVGYLVYCGTDVSKYGNLTLENVNLERPTDGTPGSAGWYFNFEWNGNITWTNVDVAGASVNTNNYAVGYFYGLGDVTFNNCNFTSSRRLKVGTANGAGAAFWYGAGAPDVGYGMLNAMNLTFNNCALEPAAVGDNKMGIFWTQIRSGWSLDTFPNGTVIFDTCKIREDDGFLFAAPNNWERAFRVYGPSTWKFIKPTFTGRCGDIFFFSNGTYPLGAVTYTFPSPNVTFEGTADHPVNFDPLTTGTLATTTIARTRNGGEVTFKYCRNTVRSGGLMDFTFNGALTSPGVVNFENCYFPNGCGSIVLKPGTAPGASGIMADSPYPMTVNAVNTIWQGTGTGAGTAIIDCGGPGSYTVNTVRSLPTTINLTHCTMFNSTPNNASGRLIQGTTIAEGGKVDDVINANYCIFQSSNSRMTNPSSNLALTGNTNVAIWDWGVSGFPTVPAGTIISSPALNTAPGVQGYLTERSIVALGKAVGSTETTDVDGETRPIPAGGTPDIGADEASFASSYSSQPTIAAAKDLSGEPLVEVDGVVTQKFTYGGSPFFYMEDASRASGIRVAPLAMPSYAPGVKVKVQGYITKVSNSSTQGVDSEHVLIANSVSLVTGSAGMPGTLGMTSKSITAANAGIALDNEGLYASVWGVVTHVDSAKRIYWINDGSNLNEGTGVLDGTGSPVTGIRIVVTDPAAALPNIGSYVGVSGSIGAVVTTNAAGSANLAVPCVWQNSATGF